MKRQKKSSNQEYFKLIFNALIMLGLGILLTFNAESMLKGVSIIFGFLLIIMGVLNLVDFYRNQNKTFKNNISVSYGIILLIAGSVLISSPAILANILVFTIGIFITFHSISKIKTALDMRDLGLPFWQTSLTFSIITLILGINFLIRSFTIATVISNLVGISLIVYAVFDLINIFLIKDKIKHDREIIDGKTIIEVEDEK